MKALSLLVLLTPMAMVGCNESPPMDASIESSSRQQQAADKWFVESQTHASITNGILAQRTMYPYHFDPASARLTDLGRRDLAILADYFRNTSRTLTLVRGDASDELYLARTGMVRDSLKQAGIDLAHVTIADGAPGGAGISGQYIVDTAKSDKGQYSGASPGITIQGLSGGSSDSNMKGISK